MHISPPSLPIRPTAKTLLDHPFITDHSPPPHLRCDSAAPAMPYPILPSPFSSLVRCSTLEIQNNSQQVSGGMVPDKEAHPPDHLNERPLREVYYLWSLAGGDLEVELQRVGLLPSKPPIFTMPRWVWLNQCFCFWVGIWSEWSIFTGASWGNQYHSCTEWSVRQSDSPNPILPWVCEHVWQVIKLHKPSFLVHLFP